MKFSITYKRQYDGDWNKSEVFKVMELLNKQTSFSRVQQAFSSITKLERNNVEINTEFETSGGNNV